MGGVEQEIDADDVREAKLDADAFGRVFPEIKIALLVQVMRVLLRTPGIPAPAKRLIAATLDKIGESPTPSAAGVIRP